MNSKNFWKSNGRNAILTICFFLTFNMIAIAQPANSAALDPKAEEAAPPQLPTATERRPDRIKDLLSAYHGFSREQMDAVSTDVPQILMELIRDSKTSIPLQRNAVKALRFYPTEDVFQFVSTRLEGSPANFQKLYLLNLREFSQGRPESVLSLVAPHTESSEIVIRHIAISVLSSMSPHPGAQTLLRQRLEREDDLGLKRKIRRHLLIR